MILINQRRPPKFYPIIIKETRKLRTEVESIKVRFTKRKDLFERLSLELKNTDKALSSLVTILNTYASATTEHAYVSDLSLELDGLKKKLDDIDKSKSPPKFYPIIIKETRKLRTEVESIKVRFTKRKDLLINIANLSKQLDYLEEQCEQEDYHEFEAVLSKIQSTQSRRELENAGQLLGKKNVSNELGSVSTTYEIVKGTLEQIHHEIEDFKSLKTQLLHRYGALKPTLESVQDYVSKLSVDSKKPDKDLRDANIDLNLLESYIDSENRDKDLESLDRKIKTIEEKLLSPYIFIVDQFQDNLKNCSKGLQELLSDYTCFAKWKGNLQKRLHNIRNLQDITSETSLSEKIFGYSVLVDELGKMQNECDEYKDFWSDIDMIKFEIKNIGKLRNSHDNEKYRHELVSFLMK